MAEVIGTVAAVAGLVELFVRTNDRFQRSAKELEDFKKSCSSAGSQIERLRVSYMAISGLFSLYTKEVDSRLEPDEKRLVKRLLLEMSKNADNCEETVRRLKLVMSTSKNNKELERLRNDLQEENNMFYNLQTTLTTHFQFHTFRRFSDSEVEKQRAQKVLSPPTVRRNTNDSAVSSSSGGSSTTRQYGPSLARHETSLSDQTLVGSVMTRSGPNRSFSGGSSSDSTQTVRFLQDSQLKSAIEENKASIVDRIIEDATTISDKESRKASALLLACRYGRAPIVKWLLSKKTSVDATDEKGWGVMHNTIGETQPISEARIQSMVEILKMLESKGAHAWTREDAKDRRCPLHFCAISGNYPAAQFLLAITPAIVNLTDAHKKTALYHACEQPSPNKKLVKLLLEKKATFGSRSQPKLGNNPRNHHIRVLLEETTKRRSLSGG